MLKITNPITEEITVKQPINKLLYKINMFLILCVIFLLALLLF